MCAEFILDGVKSIKYLTAKNLKSAKDNIYTICSRYKKRKGYDNVEFEILYIKEISFDEYNELVNKSDKN